jgi:hypothetical protein
MLFWPLSRKRDDFLNNLIEKVAIMPTLGIKVDEYVVIDMTCH